MTDGTDRTARNRNGMGSVRAQPCRLWPMSRRAFSREGTPEKAVDYHGACRYSRTLPDVLQKGVKSLNVEMPFEEALKLRLALDSCLFSLNRYNRSTTRGRAMGVVLSIKTESSSIAVIEAATRRQDGTD